MSDHASPAVSGTVRGDVVLLSMDDDEPDFTADEIDDMWEFGGDDLDYEAAMMDEHNAEPEPWRGCEP